MSRSLLILCSAIVVTTLIGAAVIAEAQGTGADLASARQIAAEAAQAYNTGNFEEALALYERAYAAYAAPQLQFNLGQCHRELGHHGRAVFFFERYLEELPDAPNRATVLELIAEGRARIALAAREAAETGQRGAERVQDAHRLEMARQREDLRLRAAESLRAAERLALDRTESFLDRTEPFEEWWLWTLVAAVLAAGIGVTVGVVVWQTPVLPGGSLGTVDAR